MRTDKVYKSSEYEDQKAVKDIPEIDPNEVLFDAFKGVQKNILSSFGEIKEDVSKVSAAVKEFPTKSLLRLIGLFTVLYIGFKLAGKFGMMGSKS